MLPLGTPAPAFELKDPQGTSHALPDADRRLRYRGQLDDSRPGNGKAVSGHDLRAALDAVLAGEAVDEAQKPSIGCNIKWKPGNAPDYF